MGENDGWCQPPPVGLLPNGLLPGKAASVVRDLDGERWVKAEERAAELIACIQPSPSSEERRNAVAKYVQRLIMECFPCQVFTFGSVPLKTYLPDGDIDLTAFSENNNLKDTWAHLVRDVLEKEENNVNAEFRVKEVQYIQAEVKLIKCLVENIVVDISFDQVGGLCTLCFLEEVDNLVKQNHLFKRSIILIKAWCYYESRILGAHHGLISTYALETLVLYIFHVYNNSFAGPLEVLYRFLAFFSNFDWENFCVSLWGPVPISSLPVGKAEPPRKDGGDLLLSQMFLKACGSAYAVFPAGQENQAQPFVAKHFNVIDPLRLNNNLGRSVSKGNFFRIRSAFSFGAKRLARLLDCPKEEIYNEVNQFFTNTWYRHGGGDRPDAAGNDLGHLRLSNSGPAHGSEDVQRSSSSIGNENHFVHNTRVDVHSQHNNSSSESTCKGIERGNGISVVSVSKSHNNSSNVNNARASDHSRNQSALNGKGQRNFKLEPVINNYQGRHLFARTRSSPELTEAYGEVPSQSRDKRLSESGKSQTDSARLDGSRRKNRESEDSASHNIKPVAESLSVRLASSHQILDSAADTNSAVNKDHDDLGSGSIIEEFPTASAQGMEENDSVSATHGVSGQFHVPVNFASGHFPFPIPPSVLASMGYTQRNMGGVVPTHIPMIHAPWGTHMQIPQGLVSSPFAHYLSGGFPSNLEKVSDSDIDNFGSSEINPETGHDFWHEQARVSADFDIENGGCEMHQTVDTLRPSSEDVFVSSRIGDPKTFQKLRESGSTREEIKASSQFQVKGDNQTYFDDRNTSSRSVSVSRASSVRSKTSSESSWDGTMSKVSKPARERQIRKAGSSGVPFALSIRGKSVSELSAEADENTSEWSPTLGSEVGERDASPQPTESLIVPRHQMHGFEPTQTSGSDSVIQMAPFLLGHGSQQRSIDNSGGGPFAFYATGPPVPFVAMLPPFYNFLADAGTTDASNSHFSRDESLENIDSNKNVDVSADLSEVLASSHSASRDTVEPLDHKPDILNSDFASHVQNLQYGRFCQNSRFPAPLIYPSPGVVPPAYLQNTFPWDGLERRLASDSNVFNQLASYGQPHLVTVAPPQSVSTSSANVYPHYTDEMPRHRSGTGTYFPNPLPARDRQSTSVRRGNYNHDRYDHHSDRDGNWNMSPRARVSGRSHTRNQPEKSNPRKERTDRHWGSYRHEPSHPSYHSQNGPTRPNSSCGGSANMAYGVYRPPAMRHSSGTSGGSGVPSVMLYAYDHSVGHGSSAEQLEFGSLGPIGFRPAHEDAHMNEVNTISTGAFEEPRFRSSTGRLSSPDEPSSPHHSRGEV